MASAVPHDAVPHEDIKIAVPQTYKAFVVQNHYRSFWYILAGVLIGVNAVYYLVCLVFHWKWQLHLQVDWIVLLIGLISYANDARKVWYYEINEHRIKLFAITPKSWLANLKELEWEKTEVIGIEQNEWRGLPCLKLVILPNTGYTYVLVYSSTEKEVITTKILPLIEKYRHQYRQELWADKLRL